jgi:ParB/RepB/Spo0J family partition protein
MTQDIIVQIPLEDLYDSPFQPRTTYTGLEGLAAAIKAEGCIHQPLLVRPRIGPLFGNDPDAAAGYEIVYGHRRRRAAELAGLAAAPCTVRTMTDAQVRSAQMVESKK